MHSELIEDIEDAFAGVQPGSAGLREAIQFDKYGLILSLSDKRFADARAEDQGERFSASR
jgi:hypothetical protein